MSKPSAETRAEHLDNLDRRILRHLLGNSRVTNTEVATALGVTEATVRKRITRLAAERLVEFLTIPTQRAIGPMVNAMLRVAVDEQQLAAAAERAATIPVVRYAAAVSGERNLFLEVVAQDNAELIETLAVIGGIDGVRSIDSSIVLDITKFTYEWEFPQLLGGS